MKSTPKLISHYIGILFLGAVLLPVVNLAALTVITSGQPSGPAPWTTAREAAQALQQTKDGYVMPENMEAELEASNAWAIFVDEETKCVVWQTKNLPDTIPLSYTLSDISRLTRGYVADYPTITGESENGLLIIGYPKERFWKQIHPSWDYRFIANLPKTALLLLLINAAAIFLIYIGANFMVLKSIKPITNGIKALPSGEAVYLPEKGLLSEVAANINRTSEVLQSQKYQLRKRERARANWIAGVSHDIRTPLSMVMGYAGYLKENAHLSTEERQKVSAIVRQSERIRNLINDLNLASKLEYNMQPIHLEKENLVAIARHVVVDFMNIGIEDKFNICWETDESLTLCPVNVDKNLIKRAVGNLIQNSIRHNEQGCTISVTVAPENAEENKQTPQMYGITVSDDGIGITDAEMDKLNHTPHYMFCDENTTEQRHGLGLLIVKQIATSHGGTTAIERGRNGGFTARILLPVCNETTQTL